MRLLRSLFGPRYTLAREMFTAEDEALLRDLLGMPHYQALRRRMANRTSDLAEEGLQRGWDDREERVGRIEELQSFLQGIENLAKPRPKHDPA